MPRLPKTAVKAGLKAGSDCAETVELDLVTGLRQGDRQALASLYDLHADRVYTLAYRILRSDAEAESIVSDVFYEVWRKPERFKESRGGFRTYLLVVTRSRSLDRLRSRARREERTSDGGKLLADEQVTRGAKHEPLPQAIKTEHRHLIKEAIERLDSKQREPIQLAYFEGLTHREIADRLNEPLGTVKTRVRAALQSLRSSLRNIGRHDNELP